MITAARKIGENLFAIQSFNGDNEYIVSLAGAKATCSCPHYTMRLAGTDKCCKHITTVEAQVPMIEAMEKAASCTDTQIERLLPKYANEPVVGGALRLVRAERRAAAENEAKLKNVFA